MEQLKGCPFCGGGPIWNYYTVGEWDEPEDCWNICCDTCGITFEEGFRNRKDAIEAWNRRAIDLGITNRNEHLLDVQQMIPERTAKVIGHEYYIFADVDGSVGIIGSPRKHEWLCGDCKKKVLEGDDYCSHCGCKLIWSEE